MPSQTAGTRSARHSAALRVGIVVTAASTLLATGCSSKAASSSGASGNGSTTSSNASTPQSASSAPSNGSVTNLTLMTWGDVSNQQKNYSIFQQVDPADAAKYKVTVTLGGANDTDSTQKLRLMLASGGDVPDIVQLNYTEVPEFATSGALADIGSYVQSDLSAISPAAVKLMQYDGKYVAFPFEVKEKLWFYRKDLFAAAGIDPASIKSVDDLIAAGKKLQASDPKAFIWNLGPAPQQYTLMELLSGNGAKFLDKQAPGCKFVVGSDPGVQQAFQALKQLSDSGVVANVSDFTPDWSKGFADGTIASSLIASWAASFIPGYAPDQKGKWGVAQYPDLAGSVGGSEGAGSVFVIPAKAKHKAEAAAYLKSLYLSKQVGLALWTQTALYPTTTAALNDPAFTGGEAYFGPDLPKAYAAAAAAYKVFPYDPASIQEITILNQALISYLTAKSANLSSILSQAQSNMQQQIGCPYK